jgi:hypothetical protein
VSCHENDELLVVDKIDEMAEKEEIEPINHAASSIKLYGLEEGLGYSNHDIILFSLELSDELLVVSHILIAINDSIIELTSKVRASKPQNSYGCYYWYNNHTLPLRFHSIKAFALSDKELIRSDCVTIKIEGFRNKYVKSHHFASVHWCNPDNPSTTQYDRGIKLYEESPNIIYNDVIEKAVNYQWIGNPPPKRRPTIHFDSNLIMTASLTSNNEVDYRSLVAWRVLGTYASMAS